MKERTERLQSAWGLLPIAVFVLLWEIVGRFAFFSAQMLFPPFSAVMVEFYHLTANGVLGENFLRSLTRVCIGLLSGSVAGVAVGIVMGWKDMVNKALSPIISLLFPIPALGWLPLLILWVGINEMLPITIIFICSFFPCCLQYGDRDQGRGQEIHPSGGDARGFTFAGAFQGYYTSRPPQHFYGSQAGGRDVVAGTSLPQRWWPFLRALAPFL